ncbi:E3 ubiquitin-protein ligase TRIM39-like [Candoia aspera]|uniref:E3 ubiquitin-protein ligase TRIM39-like n=1 Tax=Candoia aspera TaxID=51853 RepID=UPI002FD7DCC8
MATWNQPMQELLQEGTCSICLEFFQEPVVIPECGHNFCQSCLAHSWGEAAAEASCPQCRRTFVPQNILVNRQLARMVDIAQRCSPWGGEGGGFCGTHWEPLKLFCKDHETLICMVCVRSQEHRDHRVIPLEEAFQEYQLKIGDCLKAQKEEREKMVTCRTDAEQKVREMLDLIQRERGKTVAEFRELRCWLEDQEKLLLARMEETEKEVVARRDKGLAQHVEELCSLDELIQEMEQKHQQPARELLADIGSTLKKYQAKKPSENPVAFPLEMKWTIWDYRDISIFLKGIMKQFRDTLEFGLHLQEAKVILDPGTAHPCLAVSEDRKSVRYVVEKQDLPQNPERFEHWCYVLGCQGFSRGRHFWEVTLGDGDQGLAVWAVGVAKKSVNRKGDITSGPEGGIWEIVKYKTKYEACIPPEYPELHQTKEPKRVRVSLNCEGGQVAFFDAQTAALLYTFSDAPWAGEILLPSFFPSNGAYLTLSS